MSQPSQSRPISLTASMQRPDVGNDDVTPYLFTHPLDSVPTESSVAKGSSGTP